MQNAQTTTALAFLAADCAAATISAVWLNLESSGVRLMSVTSFLFCISLGVIALAPAIALAYPTWLVLRSRNVCGILPIAATGSFIAVIYFLALVAAGLGAPSG